MLKIIDKEIFRNGQKVGWIESNHIRARDGTKLGYFEKYYVYGIDGNKIAYINGNFLYTEDGDTKISLDTVNKEVEGGLLPEIAKCAIYALIGV